MLYVLVGTAVAYFGYIFAAGGLTGDEKKRIVVIGVLFLAAAVFWSAFEQAPTSLNLFAFDFTDRMILGWEVPATWFQSVNSAFIILLAPAFAALWTALGRRNRDLSSPAKFALGLAFAAVGFALMIQAAQIVVAGGPGTRVAIWWLVGSYFFQTVGELALSPVGLSSMTKLSPRKYVGQMMGIWFLAMSLGNLIAGQIAGDFDPSDLQAFPGQYVQIVLTTGGTGLILLLFTKPIRKLMGGID
jgi:POT family proton-dependent oligopeptide transporter